MDGNTWEVLRLASVALTAGVGSWFGMKYRLNGMADRMSDGFKDVRDDIGRVETKVDRINGTVVRHTAEIAVLQDRSNRNRHA